MSGASDAKVHAESPIGFEVKDGVTKWIMKNWDGYSVERNIDDRWGLPDLSSVAGVDPATQIQIPRALKAALASADNKQCDSNPCQNGNCFPIGKDGAVFECECEDGFLGRNCELTCKDTGGVCKGLTTGDPAVINQ